MLLKSKALDLSASKSFDFYFPVNRTKCTANYNLSYWVGRPSTLTACTTNHPPTLCPVGIFRIQEIQIIGEVRNRQKLGAHNIKRLSTPKSKSMSQTQHFCDEPGSEQQSLEDPRRLLRQWHAQPSGEEQSCIPIWCDQEGQRPLAHYVLGAASALLPNPIILD